jgi:hypothetical protein
MGKLLTCLPRLTLAQLRPKLRSTTVCTCRRDLENFPMPPWEFLLTCPNRLSSFNSDRSLVLSGNCTCLQTSHRPHGRLTFCSLFAGRWCLCLGWHSDHLIVHDQWEHCWLCARSSSKVPNAPMGDSCFFCLVVCRVAVSLLGEAQ